MKVKLKIVSYFILGSIFFSCTSEKKSDIIAKAGSSFLKKSEIDSWVGKGLSSEDSAQLVQSKIQQWAENELLAQKAEKTVSGETKKEIEDKVRNYRSELLNGYLLQQSEDSIVNKNEISEYYEKYKDNFKLNKDIVKLQYIKFNKDSVNNQTISEVSRLFRSTKKDDQNKLRLEGLNKASEFKLNDSTWIYFSDYYLKFPFPKISNKSEFLKRTKFLRLHDSINVYLVKISDYKLKNDPEPIEFSQEKIKNMLKVQKNKNYIDKLKESLLNEAKKNKEFEIYEKD
ncbi:hypothetical protein UJ101_02451 [Flavobacteriaceae bacterium UJ101]|nr:hypothetical protein UJ101_02451 [Flavobacteriaceae bacterium UJ101]